MDFKSIPLFKNILEQDCLAMVKCFNVQERSYGAGQTIYSYADGDNSVGIIVEGEAYVERIDVNGYRTILERLSKSSVFGKMLAFSSGGDFVSVVCKKPCKVVYIDYYHITRRCERACNHHSVLVRNMFEIMSQKASYLADRIEVISHRNLRDKILCCLMQLADGTDRAVLPFNLSQLADYICADRSAMMREIKKMKEDGIISVDKKIIKINKNILK